MTISEHTPQTSVVDSESDTLYIPPTITTQSTPSSPSTPKSPTLTPHLPPSPSPPHTPVNTIPPLLERRQPRERHAPRPWNQSLAPIPAPQFDQPGSDESETESSVDLGGYEDPDIEEGESAHAAHGSNPRTYTEAMKHSDAHKWNLGICGITTWC